VLSVFHRLEAKAPCFNCLRVSYPPRGIEELDETVVLTPCSNCQYAIYCSATCQEADAVQHKRECKLLSMDKYSGFLRSSADGMSSLSLIRVLTSMEQDKAGFEDFMKLEGMDHDDEELMAQYMNAVAAAKRVIPLILFRGLEDAKLVQVFAILHRHLKEMEDYRNVTVGLGLGLQSSLLRHSCIPNATVTNYGKEIVVVVARPIEQGQELTFGHDLDHLDESVAVRKLRLRQHHNLVCTCPICACTDDMPPMFLKTKDLYTNKAKYDQFHHVLDQLKSECSAVV
jgi:hypothetical protein